LGETGAGEISKLHAHIKLESHSVTAFDFWTLLALALSGVETTRIGAGTYSTSYRQVEKVTGFSMSLSAEKPAYVK
jgi:hypothetical protein